MPTAFRVSGALPACFFFRKGLKKMRGGGLLTRRSALVATSGHQEVLMNRKKQETQPARGGDVAETLATYGASSLSDADLLSLMLEDTSILRATEVLAMSHGLNDLLRKSRAELLCIDLLTESEANRLAIIMEVLRRSSRCDEPILVNTPRAAAAA